MSCAPFPFTGIEYALIALAYLGFVAGLAWWFAPRPTSTEVATQEDDMRLFQESLQGQLTFEDALEQREALLAEVENSNAKWIAEATRAVEGLAANTQGTGEDFRVLLTEAGIEAPRHPNAWGALFNVLGKRGVLVKTGEMRPMKRANGRSTPVYRKVARELEAAE